MLPSRAQIVLFWGPEFIALYNEAYASTIGMRHPGALGRPARENWSELWEDLEPLLRRVFEGGETVAAKDRPFYIERHGHPETVYFDISYSPVRDDEHQVRGVFCIVSETTDRVRIEQGLRESEQRLRTVVSQSAAGMVQAGLDGDILHVNARFCDILGYDETELVGRNIRDFTYADDLADEAKLVARLAESGESFDIEKRYVRKNGAFVWVNNSVSPLRDSDGRIQQVAIVSVDIGERKKTQEIEGQLASIIASSNDAILGIDLDLIITSWNAAAEGLYGYRAEEIVGRSVLVLVPEDRLAEEPALLSRIKAGLRVLPYETKRRHKDGHLVDVLLSVSPIFDSGGRIVGASKIAHDISVKKEAERLQAVLIGEMHHRVKNVFATVIAIARQTFSKDDGGREELVAFEARLSAMARANDLLAQGDWQSAELTALVEQAVAPYPAERFEISGEPVLLPQKAGASISLALHELGTNAAKYGALSVSTGKVSIAWTYDQDSGALDLQWRERGGPFVIPPARKGFGTRLVERLLPAEMGGSSTISYEPTGVVCEIRVQLNPQF